VLRTRLFDAYVRTLSLPSARHGVKIGWALDTRFDQLDNALARWFDLDLSDAIALRHRFFEDEPRRTMIAASVLENDRMDAVGATGGPWMFVAEAMLIYLDAPDARHAIVGLAGRFPCPRIAIDTMASRMVRNPGQARRDAPPAACKLIPLECDDPREIES